MQSYRVPGPILAVALLAFTLGALATPSILISLGPMRESLSSVNPLVKMNALRTLTLLRCALVLLSILLLIVAVAWDRIAGSPLVRKILAHQPSVGDPPGRFDSVLNVPFFLVGGSLAIALLYTGLGRYYLSPSQLAIINREDGVIESVSAFLFLACAIVSLLLAFRFTHHRARAVMHSLMALGFFILAGEEVSWGQRIFGWETINAVNELNVQRETNIHNMGGYIADHLFIMAVFLYGAVFPALAHNYPFFRKLFDYIGLPIASAGLAVGFLMASLVHDWTIYRILPRIPGLRIAEVREMLTAIAFSLLMYESWSTSASRRDKPKDARSTPAELVTTPSSKGKGDGFSGHA